MKITGSNKYRAVIPVLIFLCTCLASAGLTASVERWTEEKFWTVQPFSESTIRLHVVADSNDPESQSLKMKIVGQIQYLFMEELTTQLPIDRRYLTENLDRLEQQLQQFAQTLTEDPPRIAVSLDREEFPLRAYGRMIYPPGEYMALKVVIGEGQGDNWWCLLFPAFCLPFAEVDAPEEKQLPRHGSAELQENTYSTTDNNAAQERGWKFFLSEWWSSRFINN